MQTIHWELKARMVCDKQCSYPLKGLVCDVVIESVTDTVHTLAKKEKLVWQTMLLLVACVEHTTML